MKKDEKSGASNRTAFCEEELSGQCIADHTYDLNTSKPALLLHSCCGPCSTAVVCDLIHSYSITVYFYNPNITDHEEYQKRMESQKRFIEEYNDSLRKVDNVGFIEGPYEPQSFYDEVKGFEGEPECGERCRKCFYMRLDKTAGAAKLGGFDCFATTLSVSPYKNHGVLSEIIQDLCLRYKIGAVDKDYGQNSGYQRSVELSRKYFLYRQNYCGCGFSKGEK